MSVPKNSETESDTSKNAEGYLADRLHSAFELACEKFLSAVKFSHFKKKYKAIHDVSPEAFKSIFDQWTSQALKSILEDLDELCAEYSIDYLLHSLEKINDLQCSSQNSWRPSGNPEEDLRDHIYPLKLKHKENLESVLNGLVVTNEELVNVAAVNHAEIMHIKNVNEDLHGKFSNIFTSLSGTNLQNLKTSMENILEQL